MNTYLCEKGAHRIKYKTLEFKLAVGGDTDIRASSQSFLHSIHHINYDKRTTVFSWPELFLFVTPTYRVTVSPQQDIGELIGIACDVGAEADFANPTHASLCEAIYWALVPPPQLSYPFEAHQIGNGNMFQTAVPEMYLLLETS